MILLRKYEAEYTRGILIELNPLFMYAVTLELPYLMNMRDFSCIPEGMYICKTHVSHKHRIKTFQILDVPDRGTIIFHKGNETDDSLGCPLVGSNVNRYGYLEKSKNGFDRFMELLEPKREFPLLISTMANFPGLNLDNVYFTLL